jgi:hypothetical protein
VPSTAFANTSLVEPPGVRLLADQFQQLHAGDVLLADHLWLLVDPDVVLLRLGRLPVLPPINLDLDDLDDVAVLDHLYDLRNLVEAIPIPLAGVFLTVLSHGANSWVRRPVR